jgi:hypothetical protein
VICECQDLGGPWHRKPADDRPHGLNIVEALAGPDNWGTRTTSEGDRIVWARLDLLPARDLPPPARTPSCSPAGSTPTPQDSRQEIPYA